MAHRSRRVNSQRQVCAIDHGLGGFGSGAEELGMGFFGGKYQLATTTMTWGVQNRIAAYTSQPKCRRGSRTSDTTSAPMLKPQIATTLTIFSAAPLSRISQSTPPQREGAKRNKTVEPISNGREKL